MDFIKKFGVSCTLSNMLVYKHIVCSVSVLVFKAISGLYNV